jgi:hypothetical protein
MRELNIFGLEGGNPISSRVLTALAVLLAISQRNVTLRVSLRYKSASPPTPLSLSS